METQGLWTDVFCLWQHFQGLYGYWQSEKPSAFFFFFLRKVRELKVYCIYLDESFESILPAHAVITQIENRLDILFITPPQPDFYKSVVHVMQIYFES